MVTKDNHAIIEKTFAEELAAQKARLSLKPAFENQFDNLFAKKQYWAIVARVVKQASISGVECSPAHAVVQEKMGAEISATSKKTVVATTPFSPFRKRKAVEMSGSSISNSVPVSDCKEVHQTAGNTYTARCNLLQPPVKMNTKDGGSDTETYVMVVGDAVGLCQVDLVGTQSRLEDKWSHWTP